MYEPGWLLTAEHLVRGLSAVEVRYADADNNPQSATGYVRGTDRYRDLAAIEVEIDLPDVVRRIRCLYPPDRQTRDEPWIFLQPSHRLSKREGWRGYYRLHPRRGRPAGI